MTEHCSHTHKDSTCRHAHTHTHTLSHLQPHEIYELDDHGWLG